MSERKTPEHANEDDLIFMDNTPEWRSAEADKTLHRMFKIADHALENAGPINSTDEGQKAFDHAVLSVRDIFYPHYENLVGLMQAEKEVAIERADNYLNIAADLDKKAGVTSEFTQIKANKPSQDPRYLLVTSLTDESSFRLTHGCYEDQRAEFIKTHAESPAVPQHKDDDLRTRDSKYIGAVSVRPLETILKLFGNALAVVREGKKIEADFTNASPEDKAKILKRYEARYNDFESVALNPAEINIFEKTYRVNPKFLGHVVDMIEAKQVPGDLSLQKVFNRVIKTKMHNSQSKIGSQSLQSSYVAMFENKSSAYARFQEIVKRDSVAAQIPKS